MSRALLLSVAALAFACGGTQSPTAPTTSSPPPTTAGRHEVTIAGAGVTLGGVLFRPETSDPRPALVVLHGWQPAGTNGATTVEPRARRYAEEGYIALALAMRGWAPSGGSDDCGLRQPDDVVSAVAWLRSIPGVQVENIAVVGFSQGGQVALLTAAKDPRLRAVAAYYPVTDVARWKTTTTNPDIPGYVSAVCEPGGSAARSPLLRSNEINVPVLLVHGDQDTRVPTDQSVLLHAALTQAGRQADLFIVPGAQHGFTVAEEAQARPVVDAFLAARLR